MADKLPQPDAFQVRAARMLLDWSQDDLAAHSGAGRSTVRRFEAETVAPRRTVIKAIRECLETNGIVFLFELPSGGVGRGVGIRDGCGPNSRSPKPRGSSA